MIAVFDSGIGGLSIAQHIHQKHQNKMLYLSDYEGFPYGTKSDTQVIQRSTFVTDKLLTKFPNISCIVIACNTASTVALEHLRQIYSVPFIGVVPAIKPACEFTVNNTIALLATEATIKRDYTQKLIDQFAQGKIVHKIGAPDLVELAEAVFLGLENPENDLLSKYAEQIRALRPSPDTIVLGCTHFTFLKTRLQSLLPELKFIDSVEAIANRVEKIATPKFYSPGALIYSWTGGAPKTPKQFSFEIFGRI